jgi:hypothetical protein
MEGEAVRVVGTADRDTLAHTETATMAAGAFEDHRGSFSQSTVVFVWHLRKETRLTTLRASTKHLSVQPSDLEDMSHTARRGH